MDNQVIPWTEENSTAWEREFVSRCQNAWVNPLVQRTEQIGRIAAENHKILEQKVREKTFEWDNLRRQVLEKVQEMENARQGACQQLSLQVQQAISSSSRLPESLSSLESEHHTLMVRTEELFARQQTEIQSLKNLAGQIQQLQSFAKETGARSTRWLKS